MPPFDPASYADRAAIGLLVPGAGPEVTREGALAALVRGELEHDLLGGVPTGPPLLELDRPGGPVVLVSLPPEGRSTNDRRYPIALLGSRGLLTSDSTRIDGLVSVTDVATGRLRAVPSADPAAALERLDERIDRNDRLRLPLTLVLVAIVIALALVRPALALKAVLVALAANLWLEPWLALLAGVGALVLPLGLASAGVLAAYLVSLGLDAETVALSPLGPSQSGRFYGINNLLETLLLAPALLGAALLGRAGIAVAVLALVTVGGNRFGADGGGLVVLAVAYLVLAVRLRETRPGPRVLAGIAAGAVVLSLAVLALDAATGGESHVTRAVGDGPGGARERSRRPSRALGPPDGGQPGRGRSRPRWARAPRLDRDPSPAPATSRCPTRGPRRLAPRQRHAGRRRRDRRCRSARLRPRTAGSCRRSSRRLWLHSARMRRPVAIAIAALALLVATGLTACGGGEEVTPTPETIEGTLPAATTETEETETETETGTTETEPAAEGDAAAGEAVFASAGCGGCHTLEAAGSSGNVGPNLDDAEPDAELTADRVTNGQGAMPAFGDQLSEQQIADVVAYVVESTG